MREIGLKGISDSRSDKYFGSSCYEMQPRDPELSAAIRQKRKICTAR